MKIYLLLSVIALSIVSMSCSDDRSLKYALNFSGDNRIELEKVLSHYRNDPRKLEAAEFLISNMPGHYSYVPSAELDSIKAVLSDIKSGKRPSQERIDKWKSFNASGLGRIYDAHKITADYLIDNIDKAFDAYDSRPWNRYVSFEEFCETILPYRVGHEPLESWRDIYREKYGYILDSLYRGSDVIDAVNIIFKELDSTLFLYNTLYITPSLGAEFLMHNRIGGCREICDFTQYLMRSLGIPVYTDFYNQRNIHMWNTVIDTTGKHEMFLFNRWGGNEAARGGGDGRVKGKVFRTYYSNVSGDCRRHVHYRDVTSEYFGQNKARIPILRKSDDGVVWLSIFVNPGWHPVEPYKTFLSKATFKNIEPGMVFMPTVKNGGLIREAGYPFIIGKDGSTRQFIPEKSRTVSAELKRKQRLTDRIRGYMEESFMGIIEGDISPLFLAPDTIAVLEKPSINYNYYKIGSDKQYRYLRFTPAEGRKIQLGEIRAFRDTLRLDSLKMSIFSCSPATESEAGNAIDDDELTYFQSLSDAPYLILDLGAPESLQVIEWVPRNDDNFIRYGDEYELFYQDGIDGWKSLGTQSAKDTVLYYNNIPENALLILRNHTRGIEEEVFILETGIQKFI